MLRSSSVVYSRIVIQIAYYLVLPYPEKSAAKLGRRPQESLRGGGGGGQTALCRKSMASSTDVTAWRQTDFNRVCRSCETAPIPGHYSGRCKGKQRGFLQHCTAFREFDTS